jgi:hypothetical protein
VVIEADVLRSLEDRLRGRPVPDDLRALIALQAGADPDGYPPNHPLGLTETWILGPGEEPSLLTGNYLSERDRANPDIMANVAAIDEVLRHCAWVAEVFNGDVAGYWLHPNESADQPPAIIHLDSEGQFDILRGDTLVDAIIYNMAHFNDDYFATLADAFAAHGLPVSARRANDLPSRPVRVDPAAMHHRLYYAERAARGLKPIA